MMQTAYNVASTSAGQLNPNTRVADLTDQANQGLITGVKVMWSNYIVGVEVLFNGNSSGVVKGNQNQQVWEENFNLNQGDYIIQVFGRHSNVITCLGFKTAKGLTKCWGNPIEGEPFTFGLNDHYIKSLKIGVGEFVNYLEPVYDLTMFVSAKRLDFSKNGKFTVTLGKNRANSEGFDDYDWISNKFNYSIAEVKVWHTEDCIYGIQFLYNIDGAKKSPGRHVCDKDGLKSDTVALSEDEHITKIFVRAGDWVDGISFMTDKGQRKTFGSASKGNPYLAVAPEGHHFIAIAGSHNDHFDTIQFFYDEYD